MKVVIFCGGMGVRMGEATQRVPKPMIQIGSRPILWHIMKWYASYGHKDFILCLGYRAHVVKEYFLNYSEALANDFVLSNGGRHVELFERDMDDWRITFVDTGINAVVGERLKAVEPYVSGEEMFLATYGDGLTDAPLDHMIATAERSAKTGLVISVRPRVELHLLNTRDDGIVTSVQRLANADVWINGGFFVFRPDVFQAIGPGEDLVDAPFARLISQNQLLAYRYEGFWAPMDTIKDQQELSALWESGAPPWRRDVAVRRGVPSVIGRDEA